MTRLHDIYLNELIARGCTVIPDASTKYTVLLIAPGSPRKVYLGRNGAIRIGCTIRDSVSMAFDAKARMLVVAKERS